jgi:hypothetical protein
MMISPGETLSRPEARAKIFSAIVIPMSFPPFPKNLKTIVSLRSLWVQKRGMELNFPFIGQPTILKADSL